MKYQFLVCIMLATLINIGMHLRPLRTHQPDDPDQADGQRLRGKAYQCAAARISGLRYLWVAAVFAILIVPRQLRLACNQEQALRRS